MGAIVLNRGQGGRPDDDGAVRRDFELAFDWKISEGGNSGVIYRVGLGDNAPYRTGPEYQVLDNEKASDNKLGNHLAGTLYASAPRPRAICRSRSASGTARG